MLPNNSKLNHFSIQEESDVAQLSEEKRVFEEGLLIEGVGLIDGQFFSPSPDNLIGGKNFPIQRHYQKLYVEEKGGSTNNDEVDLQYCKKILESNRFKGLVPMIATMDLELYYRLTQMKTRTSKSLRTNRSEL